MTNLKDLLKQSILKENIPKDEPVGILLSGGIDATSITMSLLELGYEVHSYTFHLKDNYSYDAQKAKEISEALDLKSHTEIAIDSSNREVVYEVLKELIRDHDATSKTLIECLYPMYYMIPQIKQKYVFTGLNADTHFGSSKNATMAARRSHQEFVDQRTAAFKGEKANAKSRKYVNMFGKAGIKLCISFRDDDIFNHCITQTHEELNKPKQKNELRQLFVVPDVKIKNHWNYQYCAGIVELFENYFLSEPKYNWNQRKRMMDVYRDWVKDLKDSKNSSQLKNI